MTKTAVMWLRSILGKHCIRACAERKEARHTHWSVILAAVTSSLCKCDRPVTNASDASTALHTKPQAPGTDLIYHDLQSPVTIELVSRSVAV